MQFLAPAPDDRDELGGFEQQQMFRHRLPRHVEVRAQFAERLPVALVQHVEQLPATFVRQRFEHCIHLETHYATIWLHVKKQIAPGCFQINTGGMNSTLATRIAATMGLLAVALGAFGAHGLKELLAQNCTAAIWEKAVLYHFIHAVMLFVLAERKPFSSVAWWSFLVGIFFFSGSLYLLAVTNMLWLGAITPIGGVSFLFGWAWLIFTVGRRNSG